MQDEKRGMPMAFKSKRNSEKSTVEGLAKVLSHYDETVFYQKSFEGLLADYVPYAYAFKSRLILMGKSGDLKYFCESAKQIVAKTEKQQTDEKRPMVGDVIQNIRKKADTFAVYYGFEKQMIYHDVNLIFSALGVVDPVLTTGQPRREPMQDEMQIIEKSPVYGGNLKESSNQKTKKNEKPSLPIKRKVVPVMALIAFCMMIGAGYSYMIVQFSDIATLKALIIEYGQPFSLENPWIAYGVGGVMGFSMITLVLSLRFNRSVISFMPWLILSLQFAMMYFKIKVPLHYEWLQCYMLMLLTLYSMVSTLAFTLYKRTTRRVMSKHMLAVYIAGFIYLASQYLIRFTV